MYFIEKLFIKEKQVCVQRSSATKNKLKRPYNCFGGLFDFEQAVLRRSELESICQQADFWNDNQKATKLMQEKTKLDNAINTIIHMETELADSLDFIELGEAEGDDTAIQEGIEQLEQLNILAEKAEFEALLSGEADDSNCFLEIHSGAGGTESQDWVSMVLRMYIRFAEKRGYKVEYMEENPGEEAGLKSVTIKISGDYAYGWLKTESGVHRLVRISPFDSSARRHTSFCSVGIYPEISDQIEVDINPADVRTDTYRASGAGGQHVNTTDSAVRLTHIPTGVVVQCQNDRSQHKNRDTAWKMLRARLFELELQQKEAEAKVDFSERGDNGWGAQIRSYVLHPYQMVKDLRTGVETSDTGGVLDGDLEKFVQASLAQKVE